MTRAQIIMALAFALPCFLMAERLWRVWRDPLSIEGGAWVRLGVGVFIMEFILIHAGVLLAGAAIDAGSVTLRWGGMLGLTALYTLFAVIIAGAFKSRMLFHSFLWLIASRYLALMIGISGEEARLLHAHSVLSFALYLPLVVLSVMLPVPRFGITAEIAAARRHPGESGTWVEEPHRAIGAATVYFLLLGVGEILLFLGYLPT